MTSETIAAFDFDKTLTRCDTLLPFLTFTAGSCRTFTRLLVELPTLAAFAAGYAERQQTKEQVLTRFFCGRALAELQRQGSQFASQVLGRYIKKQALERVQWHQSQGHTCIIVSASLELYLEPWAADHGIDNVIASRMEVDSDNRITGRLEGANCWGPEKVRRLIEAMGPRNGYTLYAYGDSQGDKELLESADHPYYRKL